jgi:hypothetical protein
MGGFVDKSIEDKLNEDLQIINQISRNHLFHDKTGIEIQFLFSPSDINILKKLTFSKIIEVKIVNKFYL